MPWRQIYTAPGIDKHCLVRRHVRAVRAVTFSQAKKPGTVEVHAVGVQVIRILTRLAAGGSEGNLALVLIHLNHLAHHPLTLGDLVFHFASYAVVKVKMIPTIALGPPDDFLQVIDVPAKAVTEHEHKGLGRFINQRARLAGSHGNLDHSMRAEPALDMLE